ncbi:PRC-barrel domain-containing protein [Peribacillus sp. NPDC097675]|uniref:PRC-barrel domain-containing protein n=1 Tax=Peribacillus sp. NPDC097675 TaxID=3390618 RepID=UPI003CFFC6CD
MKKSTEILGLPIISITEGMEIGKVKSLVINPEKGSLDFITIEHEDWQVSVRAIPFKKVIGIGEYALTIETENSVIDLNEIPIANQLVNKKIKITDAKVMTRKGELLGSVREYFTDEENGQVIGMQVKVGDHEVILPSETVLTYGKDILIVTEDASSRFLEQAEQLLGEHVTEAEVAAGEEAPNGETELRNKQIELLQGKRLLNHVRDLNGNILFSEGHVLSKEDIVKAQSASPSVLVGLSMNVEA